ncbi:hypothetical protein [Sporosarcina aquimarina]|uniref:Uncharacterized protein n=1 Tax=Sporosarcina aquimarina TaxID=114975 RepID=A0ABU4G0F3_9BACL|nr:hypothetical protein [Sporosarcina aquimarina]MDW0110449.1 hypothetical protein [Sporosarcina aquimarina]
MQTIERGVTVSYPPSARHSDKPGEPMTTFKLTEMKDEAIERYGLRKYVERGGDYDDKPRS